MHILIVLLVVAVPTISSIVVVNLVILECVQNRLDNEFFASKVRPIGLRLDSSFASLSSFSSAPLSDYECCASEGGLLATVSETPGAKASSISCSSISCSRPRNAFPSAVSGPAMEPAMELSLQ